MFSDNFIYSDQDTECHGYITFDESERRKRPAVLVIHDWSGCNDFAKEKATLLAQHGYVGIAVDMYGEGRTAESNDKKAELMALLVNDRHLLRQRINAAVNTAKNHEQVDTSKIAVIGFCFGGLCALDLARSGTEVKGVASFHGSLNNADNIPNETIKAKVLAMHGHDDPMVPPEEVLAFQQEMSEANVDWQMHIYGNTMHAFTNPEANDPDFGAVYHPAADKRSFQALFGFLKELFE